MLAIRHYMCELTNKTLRRLLQEYQALSETKIFEHSLKFVFLGYCQYAHFNPYFLYDDYTIRIILYEINVENNFLYNSNSPEAILGVGGRGL